MGSILKHFHSHRLRPTGEGTEGRLWVKMLLYPSSNKD